MWFENIKTGLKWYVSDSAHMVRLKNDKDYKVVEETDNAKVIEESKEQKQTDASNTVKKSKTTKNAPKKRG